MFVVTDNLWAVEDPAAWGYLPLGDQPSFTRIPPSQMTGSSEPEPFQLFLLGSGHLDIPLELQNVVVVKTGLTYPGEQCYYSSS